MTIVLVKVKPNAKTVLDQIRCGVADETGRDCRSMKSGLKPGPG